MSKYKLTKYYLEIYINWWVFPLAVQIQSNDLVYMAKNFSITISFLCFHVRWIFIERGEDDLCNMPK